jgi:integrase
MATIRQRRQANGAIRYRAIVRAQPRKGEYIFPYDPKSVSAAFTRACKVLGIADLRFHDLRHEATSRLFERGYRIHEVAPTRTLLLTAHASFLAFQSRYPPPACGLPRLHILDRRK